MIPNDPYNSFCRPTHVEAGGAPDGPLRGLTFAVKDVFDIAGHRTGNGNPVWLDTHAPAERTASAVEHVLAAGASMVGKTHTDELAYSLNGENVHYGTPTTRAHPGEFPVSLQRIGGGGRDRPVGQADRLAQTAAANQFIKKKSAQPADQGTAAPLSAHPTTDKEHDPAVGSPTAPSSTAAATNQSVKKKSAGVTVQSSGRIRSAPPRARGVPKDG